MFVLSSLLIIHSILLLHYLGITIHLRRMSQWISGSGCIATDSQLLINLHSIRSSSRFTHLTGDSFGRLALQRGTRTLLLQRIVAAYYINQGLLLCLVGSGCSCDVAIGDDWVQFGGRVVSSKRGERLPQGKVHTRRVLQLRT